jgi:hypothetical protein
MFHLGLPQTAELALAQAMAAATALPYLCVFCYCCVHFLSFFAERFVVLMQFKGREFESCGWCGGVSSEEDMLPLHAMRDWYLFLPSFLPSFLLPHCLCNVSPFSSLMESIYFVLLLKLPPMLFPCSTLRSHFFCEQQRAELFMSFYTALCTIQAATPGWFSGNHISNSRFEEYKHIIFSGPTDSSPTTWYQSVPLFFWWNCGACFCNMLSICYSAKWLRDNFQVEKDAGNKKCYCGVHSGFKAVLRIWEWRYAHSRQQSRNLRCWLQYEYSELNEPWKTRNENGGSMNQRV